MGRGIASSDAGTANAHTLQCWVQVNRYTTAFRRARFDRASEVVGFQLLAGDFNFSNVDPAAHMNWNHALFTKYMDPFREEPGRDIANSLGTSLDNARLHEPPATAPQSLRDMILHPERAEFCILRQDTGTPGTMRGIGRHDLVLLQYSRRPQLDAEMLSASVVTCFAGLTAHLPVAIHFSVGQHDSNFMPNTTGGMKLNRGSSLGSIMHRSHNDHSIGHRSSTLHHSRDGSLLPFLPGGMLPIMSGPRSKGSTMQGSLGAGSQYSLDALETSSTKSDSQEVTLRRQHRPESLTSTGHPLSGGARFGGTQDSTAWNSHRNSFAEANFSGFVAVRIGDTVLQVAELDLNSPSEESSSEEEDGEGMGVSVV